MEKYISELDTNRFGFKIAKIDKVGDNPGKTKVDLQKQGVKLIIAKIQGSEIDKINALEQLGFRIKDFQATYRYYFNQSENKINQWNTDLIIREVSASDIPAVVSIAQESFWGYGHYFADNRLNKKRCGEIYKDWAQRSCMDKNVADKVFVSEINNELTGFLSFKILNKNGQQYAASGLGAVAEKYRDSGVFPSLVNRGLQWGSEIDLVWEEHNVLVSNYPVNRSFSKLGFRITDSCITLHCWLD